MGHQNIPKEYFLLQRKLNQQPVGAPESKSLYEILKILYSEKEAKIISVMPLRFASLHELSKRTKIQEEELKDELTKMAEKGLVLDVEKDGKCYYFPMPTVVGVFEFSLMRVRQDIDQNDLSKHYHKYFLEEGVFPKDVFREYTQIGRALVYEETIPQNIYSEILPYEKASSIIEESKSFSVGLCYCRHKAEHLEHPCKVFKLESCMSLGEGAEYLIRNKLAKRIEKTQAKELLIQTKEAGLVHIADNVQKGVSFICNCCGCCCGQLQAINQLAIYNAVMTSGFIAEIELEKCNGCGICAKKCNVNAIILKGTVERTLKAEIDEKICIGCGVCAFFCKKGAIVMRKIKQRVITPETTIERVVTMALERGKIQNLIFDTDSGFWSLYMNKFLEVIQKLPPIKKKLLSQQTKSKLINFILQEAKKRDKNVS